jgi:hypothetical protein
MPAKPLETARGSGAQWMSCNVGLPNTGQLLREHLAPVAGCTRTAEVTRSLQAFMRVVASR